MTPEKSNVPKAQKTNERTALQKHRYLLLNMYFMVTIIRAGAVSCPLADLSFRLPVLFQNDGSSSIIISHHLS